MFYDCAEESRKIFNNFYCNANNSLSKEQAKECSIIAAKLIMNEWQKKADVDFIHEVGHWSDIINELEKL